MDRDRSAWVRVELASALGARYEILDLHGQGGMGMVFCARERALERLVAIKVLAPGVGLSSDARDRFQSEARHAAALSHPSIVPVFELGETREFPYIVMEFVRGESLGRRLRHEGRLSPDLTRRILLDLADALDHAHRRGIIHRDLKPENVLIAAESGRARLADFGIAKALNDGRHLTQSGVAIGTPEYMSPEQAAGERDIDHRSDLYSLGALGYTMLAGRPPHQGDGVANVMAKHLLEEPVPLRELAPGAPPDLVAAITRCLEKRPDQRWPDARALHVALAREAGEDEPVGEELRAITGFGAFMALVLLAAGAWTARGWVSNDDFVMVIAPLVGVMVAAGFLNYARGIAANGYALRDVLRVSMWPPKWWGLWWPRGLRRPSDVWDCLPTSGRLTRVFLTFMFAIIVVYLVMRSSFSSSTREPLDRLVLLLLGLGVALVAIGLLRWTRIGFALKDASRLLFGPTVGATFWNQTHVSAVLVTSPDPAVACALPPPETVRAMLHAIEASAARLSGRARETGSTAADAARVLVETIEQVDAEIETLARNADPEELANVERRLAQLQDGQRDARDHLDKYATWMRGQADLLEMKRLDREDAHATLRAVWTLLERLREQSGRGTPQEAELLGHLRALIRGAQGPQSPQGP
jgi:predicted Ser/Thr protein kinase